MSRLTYDCPECGKELSGNFGDEVTCEDCNKTYETEWEYVGDNIACWVTRTMNENEIKCGKGLEAQIDESIKNGTKSVYKRLTWDEIQEMWEEIQKGYQKEQKERYGKSKK
jgi:hypothetical protein